MIDPLSKLFPAEQLSTEPAVLEAHARGESYHQAVQPDVVVFAESTADVQKVMRYAFEHSVPVTPVAVNTSLEGQTVPVLGGISLDLTRMNRILEFHPEDFLVVVQPGVVLPQLNEHVKRSGLFFPVDIGAPASLGGMISTNASGTAAVRYGVTSDYVLALEVVTPTGELIRTGTRARKSSSGYNLARLYCGAEGTLGVITEATLRLLGLPEAASAARVPFPSSEEASAFVTTLVQSGLAVARCEFVDARTIGVINRFMSTGFPEEVTIFLEFHGNPTSVEADAAFARELALGHGALGYEASTEAKAREAIWKARHSVFPAQLAANPGKTSFVTDVTVPISKLPEAVRQSITACQEAALDVSVVGHMGDGNFHLAIFFDPSEAGAYERVQRVNHGLIEHALGLGGTCTGEHGIGLRKLPYMALEHGASLDIMYRIKEALDPSGIMNPGKKLPARD